jgi:hypothetical protein
LEEYEPPLLESSCGFETIGYGMMFARHVAQADRGCDLDFLAAGTSVPEPEIH